MAENRTDVKAETLKALDIHAFYGGEVERLGKPDGEGHAMGLCPFHGEENPSCSINVETGRFNCFGCSEKGSIFDFYMKKHGVDFSTALSDLRKIAGTNDQPKRRRRRQAVQQFFDPVDIGSIRHYELGKPDDIYTYTCEQGARHYLYVCRFNHDGDGHEKTFRQCRPDGKGGVVWSVTGIKLVPYGLLELAKSKYCFLVEGEKDVESLKRIGLVASCNPMGAGKWQDEFNKHFKGKKVAILPDNDEQGHSHALKVAMSLHDIATPIKIVDLPGLLNKGDVTNWLEDSHTKDELLSLARQTEEWEPESQVEEGVDQDEPESEEPSKWDRSRELFPRVPFPWGILPEAIAESLQQLARSHATSALSLPGAAMAIFASVLGSTVSVSPKRAWREPLIFWFADIRPSGSGKTPTARALCKVLYEAQTQADEDYKQRLEEDLAKKKKDRRPVPRARSYFITDLTLEGLRADTTGHSGSVCVLDELSSFISGQNQYKSKGNDRESWITLHDGNAARIVRAKESFTVSGARISLVGGIQPPVWQMSFGGEKGLFVSDGTVFRFLATYEGDQFYKLTKEAWSDSNREAWERTLTLAMEWSDDLIAGEGWKPKTICLSDDAQGYFFDWCNRLQESKSELPDQLKGYIPKLIGYSLRLAGVLYCMNHFATGSFPGLILEREDMQKGVDAATFYAGHIVDAAQSLCSNKQIIPFEITEQVKCLANILESLRCEVGNGHLAVGYIQERFNEGLKPEQQIKYPHAMGALLRKCGLTIPAGHFRANKKTGAKCLLWDKKTENFLKQVNKVHLVNNSINHAGLDALTSENQSQQSQQNPQNITQNSKSVDFVDIEKPKSTPASLRTSSDVDKENIVDIVSKENKKTELEAEFEEGVI